MSDSITFNLLMRKLILLTWILALTNVATAQKLTVSGALTDTSSKKQLQNASILLIKKKDSSLVTFSRTNAAGEFRLKAEAGKYMLMATYPGFGDYADSINLVDEPVDLGSIFLTPKSKLLEEIIVRRSIPAIRMKGDTVVYKADSFRVQPGASVEDLLKKLPGIVVDKNGNITAQGEKVKKIMVDGEEFFSDDPTIATKNLQAAMVDELEVFEKKSDKAEFTGIDDGQRTKTINLKIKEDKKNGYFGKLELGSDMNNYWSNSAMINYFKGKKKFAVNGIMASDGRTGLNFNEMMNYGGMGNMDMEMTEGGGMSINIESSGDDVDFGGRFEGEGLPRSWSTGMHYSNKWDRDRQGINSNYRYKKLTNDARVTSRSQNILPDTTFFNNERSNTYTTKQSNNIDATYNAKLDSTSSLKVFVGGVYGKGNNFLDLASETLIPSGDTVNKGRRQITGENSNEGFNSTITYRKKFKKPGNSFTASFRQSYTNRESDGYLRANNAYFDSKGFVVRQDTIDQEKLSESRNESYTGSATYTRSLTKRTYLGFDYSLGTTSQYSLRRTLEQSMPGSGKYDKEIAAFTNEFDFRSWKNQGGMTYTYSKPKKITLSVGGSVSYTNFNQQDLRRDTVLRYDFVNFFPQANLNLNMKKNTNLYMRYSGRTDQPSISDLQPVADNSNPFNVKIGNPDLGLAVNHELNLWLNKYDMLSESGFFLNYSANLTQNAFSQRSFTDSIGRTVTQAVNVNGNFNNQLYLNYNLKPKNLKNIDLSLGPNANYAQYVNFVNGLENKTRSGSLGFEFRVNYRLEKKMDLSISTNPSYNFSQTSIRTDIPTNYWLQSYGFNYAFYLTKKWEVGGEVTANLRQKTAAFPTNNNAVLWNSWLDRKLGKNDPFKIRIYAFDILNQNIGFRRTITSNFINERTYNTFNRYLMLSFIWNFSKNGKPMDF